LAVYELGERRPILPPPGDYWIAPNAQVIGAVELKKNASVWFGSVVRGDNHLLSIGENSNIQDGCVVHTDADLPMVVGDNCTIGHMVMLHGCTIGDGSLIGIGAVVLNRARIGRNSIVGANSLITEGKEFPDNVMIMGSPGKVVRELEPGHTQMLMASAAHYVANWKRYAAGLRQIDE